jgi:hypothetical protein
MQFGISHPFVHAFWMMSVKYDSVIVVSALSTHHAP